MCGAHTALVESQVHSLHLAGLHLPWWQQLLYPAQHLAQESFCFPQDLGPKVAIRRDSEGGCGDQATWVLTS